MTTTEAMPGACTTSLRSLPDRACQIDIVLAISGSTYSLPMLVYDINITRSLRSCGAEVMLPPARDG